MSSAGDNQGSDLCEHLGPRSGSKLFDTPVLFRKNVWKKNILDDKKNAKVGAKVPSRQS